MNKSLDHIPIDPSNGLEKRKLIDSKVPFLGGEYVFFPGGECYMRMMYQSSNHQFSAGGLVIC